MHSLTARRIALLLCVVMTIAVLASVQAPRAHACTWDDPNCVSVTVSSGGQQGHRSGKGSGVDAGAEAGQRGPACTSVPGRGGTCPVWTPACADLINQYRDFFTSAALRTILSRSACPAREFVALLTAVTPAMLAQEAADSFELPLPSTSLSPYGQLQDGRPYTVVRSWVWFWTAPSTWHSFTARAAVGAVWAQVTATPVRLSFTPGDRNATVSCAGPGRPWIAGRDAQTAQAPGGCDYLYQRSTAGVPGGEFTATFSITWQLTWTGSGNTSGTLTSRSTSSTARFAVVELQAVIVH